MASGVMPAASEAAAPPLEPPGVRCKSQGFRVGPKALFSVLEPIANSSMLVLPSTIKPASSIFCTLVAL
jgi:hypothetical protein